MNTGKFFSLLLATSILLPQSSFAQGPEAPTAEDIESAYQFVCVPDSDKNLGEEDSKKAAEFRISFHQFLKDPSIAIEKYREMSKSDSFLSGMGAAILIGTTCGVVDILKVQIQTRGCVDASGTSVSIAKALELCAPILEENREK